MNITIHKRRGPGYKRWGVVLRGKGATQWVHDDLTKGQARSREAWIGKVIGLFQERERRIGDGADHVLARKQRGIGKECWEVGWEVEDGHTDRAFGAALTRRNAAGRVLDVNTIIDRFVEQRAVDAALAELANWHVRTTWLTSGGRGARARELAEIRRFIEGCLRKINAA